VLFQFVIIVFCFVVVEFRDEEDDDAGDLALSFFLLQRHSVQRG